MSKVTDLEVKACIGFDLGNTSSHYCLVGEDGQVELRGQTANERGEFERVLRVCPGARVVIETSRGSHWIGNHMRALGREVYEANPRRLHLIAESSRKTDRNDAELLAKIGRADVTLLNPVHPRSGECMEARLLLRVRQQLVTTRARAVNSVRGSLAVFGHHVPSCATESFAQKAWPYVPENLKTLLAPLFSLLRTLDREINRCPIMFTTFLDRVVPRSDATEVFPESSATRPVAERHECGGRSNSCVDARTENIKVNSPSAAGEVVDATQAGNAQESDRASRIAREKNSHIVTRSTSPCG